MHKTTLNLDTAVFMRLSNRAAIDGTTISELVNRLLTEALERGPEGEAFASHGFADADVDDLGANAEKDLFDTFR
jgi:macrodomain Ter protein organizer (MatP/YcbG family)